MIAPIREDGGNERRQGGQAAVYPPRRQRQLGEFCSLAHGTGKLNGKEMGGVDNLERPEKKLHTEGR